MVNTEDISNISQLEEIRKLFANLSTDFVNLSKGLHEGLERVSSEVTLLKDKTARLESRIEHFERKEKKNNIVIYGLAKVEHTGLTLAEWIIAKFSTLLGIEVPLSSINNVYFVGRADFKAPLVVEFTSFITKSSIFKNLFKLKGSGVFIGNDLAKKDREINRVLVSHLKEAKKKKLVAHIRNNRLYVGEECFSYDQLVKGQPEETNDDVLAPPPPRKSISSPATPIRPIMLNDHDDKAESSANTECSSLIIAIKQKFKQTDVDAPLPNETTDANAPAVGVCKNTSSTTIDGVSSLKSTTAQTRTESRSTAAIDGKAKPRRPGSTTVASGSITPTSVITNNKAAERPITRKNSKK